MKVTRQEMFFFFNILGIQIRVNECIFENIIYMVQVITSIKKNRPRISLYSIIKKIPPIYKMWLQPFTYVTLVP